MTTTVAMMTKNRQRCTIFIDDSTLMPNEKGEKRNYRSYEVDDLMKRAECEKAS